MITIIAGSRIIPDSSEIIAKAIENCGWEVTEIVTGMAKGIDIMAWKHAKLNDIPVAEFPAHWDNIGRSAGILRNIEMANYANALIAIWANDSRGTKHMIERATHLELKVKIYRVELKRVNGFYQYKRRVLHDQST